MGILTLLNRLRQVRIGATPTRHALVHRMIRVFCRMPLSSISRTVDRSFPIRMKVRRGVQVRTHSPTYSVARSLSHDQLCCDSALLPAWIAGGLSDGTDVVTREDAERAAGVCENTALLAKLRHMAEDVCAICEQLSGDTITKSAPPHRPTH
jgi:hypothetical protein